MSTQTFTCPICRANFIKELMLDQHLTEIHATESALQRSYCRESFDTAAALDEHLRRRHAGQPAQDLPCPECGLSFATAPLLEEHLAREHPALPGMSRET